MAVAAPACAGTLYKCVGADGIPGYSSQPVTGAQCHVLTVEPAPAKPRAAVRRVESRMAAVAPALAERPRGSRVALPVAPAAPAAVAPGGRVVSGQLYAYMQGGVRHYSSQRPVAMAGLGPVRTIPYRFIERCYVCAARPGVDFATVGLNTTAFQAPIAAAAREFGVEEAVVRAVIHAESAYDPLALSRAGAQGLMQLMPATASRFQVSDAFDASQNIRGGVRYLAWLLQRFHGDLGLAAAGYNAGEGAVDRYRGVPPYAETQRYAQRVAVLAERYRGALGAAH